MRQAFLAGLPRALAAATTAAEQRSICTPPAGAAIASRVDPHQVWVEGRLVPAPAPRITLAFDPPADARELSRLWGIERPVAVSGDVHQRSWSLLVAGDPIPDEYGPRIAAEDPRAGPWVLRIGLSGRPEGPLPGVSAGASPAYDVMERGGEVVSLEIALAG